LLLVLQRLHRLVGIPHGSQIFESLQFWARGIASRRRRRLVSKQMIVLARSIPFKPQCSLSQVYDVSNWADQHPGGRVIYTYAGKDATDVFAGFHSPASWGLLRPLYVGELLVSFV